MNTESSSMSDGSSNQSLLSLRQTVLESILDLSGFTNEFAKEFSVSPMNIQNIDFSNYHYFLFSLYKIPEGGFFGLFSGNWEFIELFMRIYIGLD